MAPTDRFQPGDQIEYLCHDPDPAAPTGGWVPGTFRCYLPWPEGHAGGSNDMKALVIPQGLFGGEETLLEVPIDELRFPPPAPGLVIEPPPPDVTGDVMPTVVNGMLVVSAFRILPVYGSAVFTWRVILRDHEARRDAPATYTVTRVRWATAAPDPRATARPSRRSENMAQPAARSALSTSKAAPGGRPAACSAGSSA